MNITLFENDQWSISLDQVTWVEKKRDGGITIHFPGSDMILMNKTYSPPFMEAYQKYHDWRSGAPRQASSANGNGHQHAEPQTSAYQ